MIIIIKTKNKKSYNDNNNSKDNTVKGIRSSTQRSTIVLPTVLPN